MSLDKENMKIPDGYFSNFSENLDHRIDAMEDDIEKNAPLVFKIGKQEGYKIPERYFKTFAERQKKMKPAKGIVKQLRPIMAVAASILLICGWFITNKSQTHDLSGDGELYEYLVENADLLDDDLLAELSLLDYLDEEEADLEFLLDNMSEIDILELENF